ncbi:hypothetical protein [Nocardia sp. 348MFTsu5.1]|uniref:hypothetical protein n=1 Tax=Nocardia sp. 348MFTsu5.1 TaxID=1172185 RepID=UPI00037F1FE6|nr:hypothetical protein [Nocardia sp. 348MFTsu5.1]
MTPAAQPGGPSLGVEDLHRMAWQMHHQDGMSWAHIAAELEEPLAAVERMAALYQQLTDQAADEQQHTLF